MMILDSGSLFQATLYT